MVAGADVRGREVHPRFRLALAVAAALLFAPGAHAGVPRWCGGTPSATDAPDVVGGDQIHLIYATPSDGTDRFTQVASAIGADVAAIDAWWRKQDPTRAPRWDLVGVGGCLDISDVKLPHDTAYYNQTTSPRLALLRDDLVAAGFADPAKKYLVYYEQQLPSTGTECGAAYVSAHDGAAKGYAGVFSAPNLERPAGARDCGILQLSVVAAHELVNELGALDPAAPHKCPTDPLQPKADPGRDSWTVSRSRFSGPRSRECDASTVEAAGGQFQVESLRQGGKITQRRY